MPYTQRVRDFAISSNDEQLPSELNINDAFTTRRNAVKNLSNWKNRLTPDEIDRILRRVESVSKLFYSDAEWE